LDLHIHRGAIPCLLIFLMLFPAAVRARSESDPPAMADPAAAAVADLGLLSVGDPAVDAGLDDLRAFAAVNSPAVAAARNRWRAAAAAADGAGALPDPRLGIGWMLAPVETRVGPQRQSLGISQTLPWFGTLGLRKREASGAVTVAAAEVRRASFAAAAAVARSWWELTWLGEAERVASRHLDLMIAVEVSARAGYAVGKTDYADILRAQMELGNLENRLADLRERRKPLTARINAVMGRPAAAALSIPQIRPDAAPLPDAELLRGLMLQRNPELGALAGRDESLAAAAGLAAKKGWPDLTVGLDWIRTGRSETPVVDSGQDPVVARLSFSLPLWRGAIDAGKRRAAAGRLELVASRQDIAGRLEAELADAVYRHGEARRRQQLYEQALVPRGRQALAAIESAYATGDGGFLDLIEARRALLDFELDLARSVADQGAARASIESLVGGRLPAAIVEDQDD